jgi:TonB-dependent Receptor Plug Domain
VALQPGVSYGGGDQLYVGVLNPNGDDNSVAFSINGARDNAINWTTDGADNVDRGSHSTLLNYPSVDSIAEFKVLRGMYNAEFGRGAGGQINVVTKSGENAFHGTVYEFFRKRDDSEAIMTRAVRIIQAILPVVLFFPMTLMPMRAYEFNITSLVAHGQINVRAIRVQDCKIVTGPTRSRLSLNSPIVGNNQCLCPLAQGRRIDVNRCSSVFHSEDAAKIRKYI